MLLVSPAFAEETPPDFKKSGEFLKTYCVDCHSGDAPEGGLALDLFLTGERLVKDRDAADRILEMLDSGAMPPDDAEQPPAGAVAKFVESVEKTLVYADRHAPRNPGRVTMRRLNRTEYANTVRDLLGIDFNPAADFPADDVGHGFDNIGDVLSLPPLLMERYLAAAETIAARAMSPTPAVPKLRTVLPSELLPELADANESLKFRRMRNDVWEASAPSLVVAPFEEKSGAFLFRSLQFVEPPADQIVRLAIVGCGPGADAAKVQGEPEVPDVEEWQLMGDIDSLRPFKILKTITVTSRRPLFPHEAIVKIENFEGLNKIAFALVKPLDCEKPATVQVGTFSLEGPIPKEPCLFYRQATRLRGEPAEKRTLELLSWLLPRAYRRPATEEEIARLTSLVNEARDEGATWEEAIRLALQAVLVSPKFLFRVELDANPQSADAAPVDEFQLASRLSYFLWSTAPDETLMRLAAEGRLSSEIENQTRRMLADERSSALVENFAMQWLQLRKLATVSPDRTMFPTFDEKLRASMLEETRLFVKALIDEDRPVLDLLGADFTFMNAQLAKHYGIVDANGNRAGEENSAPQGKPIRGRKFERVSFSEPNRGGLLRHASILTVTSNPTRTSPVKRGHFVLEQLLDRSPPPPPPNVPALKEAAELTGTLRQRMEQHRANPNCASCHAQMDPIGFAFENYDAIGQFRLYDGGEKIDASGVLPGGKQFEGPSELVTLLKGRRDQFVRCLISKMMTYALGRGLEYYDRPAINKIESAMAADGDKFSRLIVEICRSEPFLMRRGNAGATGQE